jgi:hypothetical protein
MKNQFKKFLLVGALAFVSQSNALAQNNDNTQSVQQLETISTSINKIIDNQFEKGYLTERADVKINVVKPIEYVQFDADPEKNKPEVKVETTDLSENHFHRKDGTCKIALSFDEKGGIPYLGLDDELKNITALKNENQKEYMRQFIALHEHFHCEFSNIQNPIQVKEKSWFFNNKINKTLKDITPVITGWGDNYSSYMDTLNESFADVSAKMALIKQHGIENKDLMYVLKVVETQRHDNYLERSVDTHFTNFALEELKKPENLKRVQEVNGGSEFKNLALELANTGTEKLLLDKEDLATGMFSKDAYKNSLMIETMREIKLHLTTVGVVDTHWNKNLEIGYIQSIAKKVTKDIDYSKIDKNMNNSDLYDFAVKKILEFQGNDVDQKYAQYKELTDEFMSAVKEKHSDKTIKLNGGIEFKQELASKIRDLRTKFMEETKPLVSHPKPN